MKVETSEIGIYVPPGDFYIDPDESVDTAVITHAHADHCRGGHAVYHCSTPSAPLIRSRVGDVTLRQHDYGESFTIGDATVSFYPAGHIRGSAQIRVSVDDTVMTVTGDYKRMEDPTCTAFEPVPCDVLVTEATFGLPIYHWRDPEEVVEEIFEWWQQNSADGVASVLFCYSLGKAQRILASLTSYT
ncbi:MAG: MBL fold metallo-hydrolase, partial [Halobacteriaceae archaeon]